MRVKIKESYKSNNYVDYYDMDENDIFTVIGYVYSGKDGVGTLAVINDMKGKLGDVELKMIEVVG